ncbi:hypothetical protein CF597_23495 [Pseudomonas sp. PSB1]|nr:hypothetical protein [Pseudomonas sp. PSB1]
MTKDPTKPCGSEPARDSGLLANEDVECCGLIASRLAPTGFASSYFPAGMKKGLESPFVHCPVPLTGLAYPYAVLPDPAACACAPWQCAS